MPILRGLSIVRSPFWGWRRTFGYGLPAWRWFGPDCPVVMTLPGGAWRRGRSGSGQPSWREALVQAVTVAGMRTAMARNWSGPTPEPRRGSGCRSGPGPRRGVSWSCWANMGFSLSGLAGRRSARFGTVVGRAPRRAPEQRLLISGRGVAFGPALAAAG